MDFAFLPPEINSGRMYTGPGPGPMLAAAAAWDDLAAEVGSTAASYASEVSALTSGAVAGPVVGGHGGRGRTVCGVDEYHCSTG